MSGVQTWCETEQATTHPSRSNRSSVRAEPFCGTRVADAAAGAEAVTSHGVGSGDDPLTCSQSHFNDFATETCDSFIAIFLDVDDMQRMIECLNSVDWRCLLLKRLRSGQSDIRQKT